MRLPARTSLRLMAYAPSAKLRRTCPPGTRIASVRRRTHSGGSTLTSSSSSSSSPSRCFQRQDQMFSTAARAHWPYKDDQDKDSVKPKDDSGEDPAASDSAFDPGQTSPEEQGENAQREKGESGLGNSPANEGASEGKGNKTEHAGESDRARTSGGGSAPKAGS